jgi:hypothetical protein
MVLGSVAAQARVRRRGPVGRDVAHLESIVPRGLVSSPHELDGRAGAGDDQFDAVYHPVSAPSTGC